MSKYFTLSPSGFFFKANICPFHVIFNLVQMWGGKKKCELQTNFTVNKFFWYSMEKKFQCILSMQINVGVTQKFGDIFFSFYEYFSKKETLWDFFVSFPKHQALQNWQLINFTSNLENLINRQQQQQKTETKTSSFFFVR